MKRIAAGILGFPLTLVGIFSSNVYAQSAEKVLRNWGCSATNWGLLRNSGGLGTVLRS